MTNVTETHFIPDTNILLHYRFREMNWRDALKCDTAHIHIAPVVLNEIATAKDMADNKTLRKRAAGICRWFYEIIELPSPFRLREGEFIHLHDAEPNFDHHPHLNPRANDDHLIAFALELQKELQSEIKIGTSDVSLKLRARLKRFSFAHVKLPDDFRLELADEDDKRLREAQRELHELKSRQPSLSASFSDGSNVLRHEAISRDGILKWAAIHAEERVSEVQKKHPYRTWEPGSGKAFSLIYEELDSEEAVNSFNQRLSAYYEAVRRVAIDEAKLFAKFIEIELVIKNEGTAPAHSVRVNFHFPNGFRLLDENSMMKESKGEPPPPMTKMEELSASLNRMPGFHPLVSYPRASAEPTTRFQILETNSYDVTQEIPKIRQGESESIKTLFAVFDETPSSFEIRYSIVADNIPTPATGSLAVVVE